MSQQKDSEQGASLGQPAGEPAPETTPASDPTTGSASAAEGVADAVERDADAVSDVPTGEKPVAITKNSDGRRKKSGDDADSGKSTGTDRSAKAAAGEPVSPESQTRKAVTAGSIALLAIAAVAAAWFGGTWIVGGLMNDRPRAQARDAAITDARQAAVNLMSINPDDIDGSLANIRSSMTGDLLKDQVAGQDQLRQTAQDSKTRIDASVEGITLTGLNSELDHASAFAVLKINRTWPGGQPASFRQLWTLDLVKQDGTWKAEKAQNLGEPVELGSGTAPQTGAPQTGAPQTQQPGN
ncbi:hypothetical protein [Nocardia jejuensis]|uniref:hypothetical protein n=1 Tax=Nocardia jejuensis TaxID=328049 RepID=UPI0008374C27|nr:hypothetical protein [Nocardia jejuensis]